MEEPKIIITLEEYNRLKDVDNAAKRDGVTFCIYCDRFGGVISEYITTNDAVKKIANENSTLKTRLDLVNKRHFETIDRFKKMSYFQFRKWKKSFWGI